MSSCTAPREGAPHQLRTSIIDFSVLQLVPQLNILFLVGASVLPTLSKDIDIF
jgi:hypothetical protein